MRPKVSSDEETGIERDRCERKEDRTVRGRPESPKRDRQKNGLQKKKSHITSTEECRQNQNQMYKGEISLEGLVACLRRLMRMKKK